MHRGHGPRYRSARSVPWRPLPSRVCTRFSSSTSKPTPGPRRATSRRTALEPSSTRATRSPATGSDATWPAPAGQPRPGIDPARGTAVGAAPSITFSLPTYPPRRPPSPKISTRVIGKQHRHGRLHPWPRFRLASEAGPAATLRPSIFRSWPGGSWRASSACSWETRPVQSSRPISCCSRSPLPRSRARTTSRCTSSWPRRSMDRAAAPPREPASPDPSGARGHLEFTRLSSRRNPAAARLVSRCEARVTPAR